MSSGSWIELGQSVYSRRYRELDLTVGLIVGRTGCLVVDTRGDVEQGWELAEAVREITDKPWSVAYTHSHFDHCYGTTAFLPCDVWAHDGCLSELIRYGIASRKERVDWYRELGKPNRANALERTKIELPDKLFHSSAELDLGKRRVTLIHPGRAHTYHDVIVHVPDAGIVFAGDVVENAPSGFSADSFGIDMDLASWPAALDVILSLDAPTIVPGHGDTVDRDFVAAQRANLADLVKLGTDVRTGSLRVAEAVARSPYPPDVTISAFNTAR